MEYLDPIETARRVLAGEPIEEETDAIIEDVETDVIEDDDATLFFEDEDLEEASHKKKANEDDEEDEDDDEDDDVEEGYGSMNAGYGKMNAAKHHKKKAEEDYDVRGKKVKKENVVNPKSEEDPDLYKDAQGKGAKVAKATGSKATAPVAKPSDASPEDKGSGLSKKGVKEHVEILFNGEDLSDDFKIKAETIFETAIGQRVEEVEAELREQHEAVIAEHTEMVTRELAEKLDNYLSYVVEQWMEENELAVETGIRADVAESFLGGLKVLFENNYVEVPEEKYDLVETLAQSVVDLEGQLQEELQNNIDLRAEVKEKSKEEVFAEVTEDLVDTDVEKVKTLVENIDFEDADTFRKKVEVIKENYLTDIVSEDVDTELNENNVPTSDSPVMNAYVDTLTRTSKVKSENTVR